MAKATAQIHLKAPQKTKTFLQMAAEISGAANLTDYILRAAIERAHVDMAEQRTFVLGDETWEAFARRLDAPVRELPELRRLLTSRDVFDSSVKET